MRKTIKRILFLCLVLCLLLQVPVSASASGFWDVPAGDWYADELDAIM